MVDLLAAFALAVAARDSCLVYAEEPQGAAAPEVRALPASEDDRTRVAALMARQDELVLAHRGDLARADFTDDFTAPDWGCFCRDELLDRWDDYLHAHDDGAQVRSEVQDVRRVGKGLVATVLRRFHGVRRADDSKIEDESPETLVLRDREGALKIAAIYETAASRWPNFDRARRTYDRRSDLAFSLTWPEPFVPVPREGPGAALDQTLFLDPDDDAVMWAMAFDPTLQLGLEQLMTGDALDGCSAEWNREPNRFKNPPPGFVEALECEVHYPADETRGAMGCERLERTIYLSPDHRMVFALGISAPPATFFRVKGKVDELARSLRLAVVRPGKTWTETLFDLNPRWRSVERGLFRTDAAPIELPIPAGFNAVPLAGDHILRVRLELADDPGTSVLVRIFPPGEDRIAADKILERSIQHMLDLACAQGQGGSTRTSRTVDVLGRHGDLNGIEIVCDDGSRRAYEIVAVDRDDCHVQVQLLPRSDRRVAQEAALQRVLDALRVRPK